MTLTRATPPLLKDLNERTVLDAIRAGAPISRAEIARRAGISKPTVSLALASLVEAGLVRRSERDPDGPSYGAVFFEPVAEAALVLGLDLGARFLRGAICDMDGRIRARQDVELESPDADGVLEVASTLRGALVETSGLVDVPLDRAVIGVPGAVDVESGRVSLVENVRGLEDRDFRIELTERLGIPTTIENDINLAAVGERWRGVAQGVDDFAFLSIGTGLGCGIVLRGELHRGYNGAAGELDYVRVGMADEIDPCAGAVSALAQAHAARDGGDASLHGGLEPRGIFAAARRGDAVAASVVEEEARRIAMHVVPLAAVTDLALVVLGGGLGANGDLLLEPIRSRLRDWLPYPPRVDVSTLGDAAVLTGALGVGLRSALENVFVNRTRRAKA
ncbi:MAG: ROK family transcriptional regulator [Gaiellaceae bacterium]|jgi:predicted NBD/HSP70 family sugar kinase